MNKDMSYGEDYRELPMTSVRSGVIERVADDVWCQTIQIANLCFVAAADDSWFLIDAGMPGSADEIRDAAAEVFGSDTKPRAIILTHGHFDHVGAIIELVDYWQVPVYAHAEELPFLTGTQGYAPADTDAGGGLVSTIAFMFPNEPINLGDRVRPLSIDHTIPGLEEWRWVHTPGHTAGHISLFRERDRLLIAGDAFVTVRQESVYSVITQQQEISGPPRYFTADWMAARRSAQILADLHPAVAVCGHGRPMRGQALAESLQTLVAEFESIAVPPEVRSSWH
ncbi:MBL fold metallo-hydrolase [Paenibacillus sp. 1P07SE]|uniref:MBL fold metallo-hydrolase n=1 Tax=Paenibacillus sp. 1P07SE TaxID=3132209 RepID=UPI0039A6724B